MQPSGEEADLAGHFRSGAGYIQICLVSLYVREERVNELSDLDLEKPVGILERERDIYPILKQRGEKKLLHGKTRNNDRPPLEDVKRPARTNYICTTIEPGNELDLVFEPPEPGNPGIGNLWHFITPEYNKRIILQIQEKMTQTCPLALKRLILFLRLCTITTVETSVKVIAPDQTKALAPPYLSETVPTKRLPSGVEPAKTSE